MIRIFHTRSGLKKAVDRSAGGIKDIALMPFSKNSLLSALKVSEGIFKMDKSGETDDFNINNIININIFIEKSKRDLILMADEELSKIFNLKLKPVNSDNFSICVKTYDNLSNDFLNNLFNEFDFIIFFLALGAVVRLISPYIKDKLNDPGVTVIDEAGKFAVSLLSGHIGGGNEFTKKAANFLGAIPVITTATDISGRFSVDMFAKKFGFFIEEAKTKIKEFNKASLSGEKFIVYLNEGEWIKRGSGFNNYLKELKRHIEEYSKKQDFGFITAASKFKESINNYFVNYDNSRSPSLTPLNLIIISRRANLEELYEFNNFSDKHNINIAILRPKSLIVGIGCNKNTDFNEVEEFVASVFDKHNLSLNCIRNIATIDIKKDESGILKFGEKYGKFIDFYSKEEINEFMEKNKIRENNTKSLCYKYTGAYSVCEPCALLSSKNKELLICKKKKGNVTMAAAAAM
ncbi:MAG: cobalamin biosynthesis protein [Deltaproteobacteria bacterium]|nr:cobalamin biosynthesis protein [Deltaproteobacteria bacterium]